MDRALSYQEGRQRHHRGHRNRRLCLPSLKFRSFNDPNPFSPPGFWVPKLVRSLYGRARMSNGSCSTRLQFTGMVVNNSLYCASPCFLEAQMEGRLERIERMEEKRDGFGENGGEIEAFVDEIEEEGIESSSSSEATAIEEQSHSSFGDSPSPPSIRWPVHKNDVSQEAEKPGLDDRKLEKQGSSMSEIEMMKERFSKLLLGEDMSGSGNGVCTALAISNAITNLCATIFGQLWRLEPLPPEKKLMWRREMEWLLCVGDHMVELKPSWQTFPDGRKLEVMTCRPRSDLHINLPALRKLDNMLLEILDSFENTEFWYVDQGILATDADGSSSFQRPLPRQEEKWWLPVPSVPPGGLSDNLRKNLQHKCDCTNQILKAAMAINSITLTEMEVPLSYFDALPKNGRASVGDFIYRHLTSDQFSPECLLDCLDLSSEHLALEIANRVEAAIYLWQRRTNSKPVTSRSNSKSSWKMVKELVIDLDKRELLAERAESLLLCLKQRCPGLPQTALDTSKIQCNKDVGKSILESYSRVLESLASNIAARIDDLLYVDDLTKRSDQFLSIPKASVVAHQSVAVPCSVPLSSTPCRISFTTPGFSPSQLIGHAKIDRSPFLDSSQLPHCGFSMKRVLTDYLEIDTAQKDNGDEVVKSDSSSSTTLEASDFQAGDGSFECSTGANLLTQNSVGRDSA